MNLRWAVKMVLRLFIFPENNIGGAQLHRKEEGENTVEIRRLDDLELPTPVIIYKIDAEGSEEDVIQGSLLTIRQNNAEFIFIEISPKFSPIQLTVNNIFIPLWEAGYISLISVYKIQEK
ncbi:MAG: FkbM family methyltransferase [Bacteroidota bacterium]